MRSNIFFVYMIVNTISIKILKILKIRPPNMRDKISEFTINFVF